jgi:hypothetical protein
MALGFERRQPPGSGDGRDRGHRDWYQSPALRTPVRRDWYQSSRASGSGGAAVEEAPSVVDSSQDVPALDVQVRAAEAHQETAAVVEGATLGVATFGAGSAVASSPIFHVRGLLADSARDGRVGLGFRVWERREKAERVSLLPLLTKRQRAAAYPFLSLRRIFLMFWRRRPESNWGWRFCRPLPYHLATSPPGPTRFYLWPAAYQTSR